ncbi:unnamed protein product [marine sediment metagenome]|uniref:Uncharacterized protein n=1 Tax=marine sediment metagenome TaxID=412755 RepID=X1GRE2_9ZZZZ
MKEESANKIDVEVNEITNKRVLEFLKQNPENIDAETFRAKLEQAKLGMSFLRDREMMRRISQGQQIRVFNLITSTPDELKEYIKVSMPEVIPKEQIEKK